MVEQTRGWAARPALIGIAVAVCAALAISVPQSAYGADSVRVVSPAGSGEACTAAAPCDLPTALRLSTAGDTVEVRGGAYGQFTVSGPGGTPAAPVTVRPAQGAVATFVRITSSVPSVVWQGLTVSGTFYLNRPATGSTVRGMHFDGGGLFVRSAGASVLDSLFENGSSVDGIQVGRASDVLIEGNTIRDYNQSIANGYHADCLQIFDSSRVTVRGNSIGNCYNAGIILSPGDGTGMVSILIESNFIQGCIVRTEACAGGSAVDLRPPKISDLVVRGNTIVDGSTRLIASPGLVFDRNIVGYLSDCAAPVTNSVVIGWNVSMCRQPTSVGTGGTRAGTVRFVDQAGRDLHLVSPTDARIEGSGGVKTAALDIDGDRVDPRLAGADTVPGSDPGEVPPPGTPPPAGGPGGGSSAPTVTLPATLGGGSSVPGIDAYFQYRGTPAVSFVAAIGSRQVLRGVRGDDGWKVDWDLTGLAPGVYPATVTSRTATGATADSTIRIRVVAPGSGASG